MTAEQLKTLHEEYRRAVEAVRDETLPEETRAKAQDDVIAKRHELDDALIEKEAEREDEIRAAAVEARTRAAQIIGGVDGQTAPAAPPRPSLRERFDEWERGGRNGKFQIVAYPDYGILPHVKLDRWNGEPVVEGRQWFPTEVRADVINETGNQGGAYVWPTDTWNDVVWHENAISGVMQAGPTILQTPDDRPLVIPTFATDLTANLTAEGTASTESAPTFAHMHLDSYRVDAHFHVGNETLRSSAVPLESILADACSRAIATKVAALLAVGTGSSQPQGLSGHATVVVTLGKETAAKDTICIDDLIGLKLSVLPAARKVGAFILASTAYVQLPTLKNGVGDYLWEPSTQANTPDRLLGCPVYEDAGYDAIGTDDHVIGTFGDMKAYWVRQCGPVVIEAAEYTTWDSFETTWRCAKWMDAELMDVAAIKGLYCHA